MDKKLKQQLEKSMTLQVATVGNDGKPWICSVYYVVDDDNNFYWLSLPSRRHSQHIAQNNNVAATVAIKTDMPVIGIQIQGQVSIVKDAPHVASIMDRYIVKYEVGKTFYERFVEGINQQNIYKLTPSEMYLFDEKSTDSDERLRIL